MNNIITGKRNGWVLAKFLQYPFIERAHGIDIRVLYV